MHKMAIKRSSRERKSERVSERERKEGESDKFKGFKEMPFYWTIFVVSF